MRDQTTVRDSKSYRLDVQVTWFFQPADDFNWITVKAFPSQDYVTIYDKYTRYSVNEGITSVDNQMGKCANL